jgi:hypothetical protein
MRFLVKHAGVARPHFAGIEDLRESESEEDGECDVAIGRGLARFSDGRDSLDVESKRRSMGVNDR